MRPKRWWRKRLLAVPLAVGLMVGLVAPYANAEPTKAASDGSATQAQERDVMLVVDGSNSVDALQWNIFTEGYARVISGTAVVPRDGSVSIGVVQFSGEDADSGTRLEVPLTPITDNNVQDVADQIRGIEQMAGNTNTGDGIVTAADHLADQGRDGAQRAICASPEGAINAGTGIVDAHARAAEAGVDKLDYRAIADPPNFTEDEAKALYELYTIGEGTFRFATDMPSFNELAYGCFNAPVWLTAIEVNQAVQDWNNSVPLVKGRDTIVRVFLESIDSPVVTSGKLRAYRNGEELPRSPLDSENYQRTIKTTSNPAAHRGELDGSLNFRIPESWTTGTVELVPELPGELRCDVEGGCGTEVSFTEDTGTFRIDLTSVGWKDQDGNEVRAENAWEQLNRLRDVLPISDINVQYSNWDTREPKQGEDVLPPLLASLELERLRKQRSGALDPRAHIHGMLPGETRDGGSARTIGQSFGIPSQASTAYLSNKHEPDATGRFRNTTPHELAHTYGIHHSVHGKFPSGDPEVKAGPCGEEARLSAPDYPHWWTSAEEREVSTIGPVSDDPSKELWGISVRHFSYREINEALAISSPEEVYSLMGYCYPLFPASQGRWISEINYKKLMDQGFDNPPAGMASSKVSQDDSDSVVIGGVDSADSDAVLEFSADGTGYPVTEDDPDGSFELRAFNSAQEQIHRVRFTPPGLEDGEGAAFLVGLPTLGDLHRVEIVQGETVIGSRANSAESSEGTKIEDLAVEYIASNDQLRVAWSGGATEQPAMYNVEYSPGGDGGWQAIANGTTATELEAPGWVLEASDEAKVRVTAIHGLESNTVTSEPVRVPAGSPKLMVDGPDGTRTYSGAQQVVLEASAYDGNGSLPPDALTWESDRDGELGTGERLSMSAGSLSPGLHIVTVTATAEGGRTSSKRIPIEVDPFPNTGN